MSRVSSKTRFYNFFRFLILKSRLYVLLRFLTKGRRSDYFFSKLVPNNYQFSKSTFKIARVNRGIALKVDLHDYLGHFVYFGFRDEGQEKLMDLVREGDYVFDVGTNIGNTILQFSQTIKKDGLVFGFEPDPKTYKFCTSNLKLNPHIKNIQVFNYGLGNKSGEFQLEDRYESNSGGNRIIIEEVTGKSKNVIVKVLDEIVEELKLKKLDLIKIDVEGFELNVLLGAKKTISQFHPIFFIEIDDNNLRDQGSSAKELIEFLSGKGYSTYHSITGKEIISTDHFSGCHFDLIAKYNA